MEVNRFENQDIPLCKFGPGGDFITEWPIPSASLPIESAQTDPIGKVLSLIGRLVGSAIGPELISNLSAENISSPSASDLEISVQEKTQNEQTQSSPDHTQAARRASGPPPSSKPGTVIQRRSRNWPEQSI